MKTLEKYFNEEEILTKGLIVKSILINQLEVCGYISSRFPYCIVNKAPHSQTVTPGYLCQTMVSLTGSTTEQVDRITVPIFHSLTFCKEAFEIELSKFYIPSLTDNPAYCKIKKGVHRQSGYDVNRMLQISPIPLEKRGSEFIAQVPKGSILCKDKDGCVKGLGEDILAVCRYIHAETGRMHYVQYELNELFIGD